jgi:cytoskeletal protein CcmA (bactofilin family)
MPEAARPLQTAPEPESALIGSGAEFDGILLLHGPARIEGRLRGEIVGTTLWVGRAATIDARIDVDEILVSGAVAGTVRVRGRALLRSTARVSASLEVGSLALEEGSVLEGQCRTAGSASGGVDGAKVPDPA